MKQLFLIILAMADILSIPVLAQQKKDSCCLLKKDIVGIWQRNDSVIGSGLNQNFQFLDNNSFILNIGNDADDVRNIVQLKGKYRLDRDMLYFTITSRTILEGPIGIADAGISLNIFSIEKGKLKEMSEHNPKEIPDPCYITLFSRKHIKINNEIYYKIK